MSVLFVCLGNICRSPTAHGVFQQMIDDAGLADRVRVDSCGTGGWHVGEAPDRRSTAEAARRGYQLAHLRARQLVSEDLAEFDYVLAMDGNNLSEIKKLQKKSKVDSASIQLFLEYASQQPVREVPDPYYGGADGFAEVLDLVEAASRGLLADVRQRLESPC
ncbi:low molecular weight protein-tyrosine-phosphatase [Oceanobacter mangrovi]|uniref:low molecular weight protein-tyrosine-phosphatase n=1 Tax=Oceanobacter mangrovi TaxID=2862510 RepID=UPI001C8DA405